jgi:hypothetical protein
VESVIEMSKKRAAPKSSKPKSEPSRVREAVTFIRSSDEWKAFVEEFRDWDRATSTAELIDRAIAFYARERGYPKVAPKR